ncbi:hypothetical protein INR49_002996 [Caranx melampygus]|nr:hypothetical protein INR49_002996 [Caranx melampygus]
MPSSRGGRLRRKGCSLARRTQRQATAAWRLLYRLLFMVSRGPREQSVDTVCTLYQSFQEGTGSGTGGLMEDNKEPRVKQEGS